MALKIRLGRSSHFLQHLFAEDLRWRFPTEAFARCVVEAVTDLFYVLIRHRSDVAFAWKPASGAAVGVLDGAFLPG